MKFLHREYRIIPRKIWVLFGIIGFATLVILLPLRTYSLASKIVIEPELGLLNNAIVINDALASGGYAVSFSAPTSTSTTLVQLASTTSVSGAESVLNEFLARYGMTAQVSNISDSTYADTFATYDVITDNNLFYLKTYGALFVQEWSKYPVSFIRFSKVKSVAFTSNLVVSGTGRAAMPDIVGDTMYYDIIFFGDYARGVIHHEFDHLFTFKDSGTWSPDDPTWRSFNPVGFVYGNGGASCYQVNNDCVKGQHPIPGFVTGYAASSIEEDKAELFSYLMTGSYYRLLKTWMPGDANLTNKVNYYKQYLASKSPEMSGNYFDVINP